MGISFEVSAIIPASPAAVYHAWLDSAEHAAMTGGAADISDEVGGAFEAWDGYIRGVNLELEPNRRIVQSWRTSGFAEHEPDSRLEVLMEPVEGGSRLVLRHTDLPDHGMQYQQGWVESYFGPMQDYFTSKV